MTEKIAVLAPIPRARVARAAAVKPGLCRSVRNALFRSAAKTPIILLLGLEHYAGVGLRRSPRGQDTRRRSESEGNDNRPRIGRKVESRNAVEQCGYHSIGSDG